MADIKIGDRYGKLSSTMATMGLRDYIATLVVVDMTEHSVAFRTEDDTNMALNWLLKEDVSKCLERIDG